ncbi:MAG TPA: BMP family ABC transporter substrate-binding protein [Tepidisphaeraceae bacterium]|jgi:simple sugar transport system substrate-binding protein|nr:BMP family ABC transporter substrate-binding protein [Tepidisphaeraceae bacterium]
MKLSNSLRSCLKAATCAAITAGMILGNGCKKDASGTAAGPGGKTMTVGFIYVGTKDDYGYNQAMADGAAAVKKLPGVTIVEQEKVPETKACQQAMSTMIDSSDAGMIFATSFGYFKPHVLEIAPKYPKVCFVHAGGQLSPGDPPNVTTFFAYIDEVEWLCGMAAGSASKTGKLGYVAAKPIPPVLRDINAFELGAKSVNPNCTLTVIFTGDWFLPDKEADAVKSLADQGIDVISGHVDSPKVMIQTAEKRGIMSCGYHYNCTALAPKGYLTGAEWNWAPIMTRFVNEYKATGKIPKPTMGNLRDGSVQLSPFGPDVSKEAQAKIEAIKKEMMAGTFQMYKGPLKDNKGKEILPAGKALDDQDPSLWGMNYLVEGVVGDIK